MSIRFFRGLIIAEVLFAALWIAIGFSGDPFLPEHLRDLEHKGLVSAVPTLNYFLDWLIIPSLILYVAALLLLWRLRRIGRALYIASLLLGVLYHATYAYVLTSGLLHSFDILSGLVSAGILVASFLPPLRSRFENHSRTIAL